MSKNSELTVLYVCDDWPVCGAAFSVLGILEQMKKKGVNVIVAVNGQDFFYQKVKELGYTVYQIPYSRMAIPSEVSNFKLLIRKVPRYFKKIKSNNQFEKLLRNEKIDIVHYSSVTIDGGYEIVNRKKIPIVWHIREFLDDDLRWRFRDYNKSIKELENSDVILTVSNQVKEKFSKMIKTTDLKTIYNGIETSPFEELMKSKHSEVQIGMVGTIKEEKGHMELLKAFSKLSLVKKNIRLIFLGNFDPQNNQFHSELKKIVDEKKISEIVEFRGQQTDVQSIWSDIDIAVVASWAEAFGRVTVEAILAKCLVVGANTGGTKEILDYLDTGIQFEAKNIDDLTNKLDESVRLVEKKEFNTDVPREKALREFSVSKNASNIFRIYKKIRSKVDGEEL